jgi:hypothetical protein
MLVGTDDGGDGRSGFAEISIAEIRQMGEEA